MYLPFQFQNLLTLGGVRYAMGAMTGSASQRLSSIITQEGNVLSSLMFMVDTVLPAGTSITVDILCDGVATGLTQTITAADGLNVVSDLTHFKIPNLGSLVVARATPSAGILTGINLTGSVRGG